MNRDDMFTALAALQLMAADATMVGSAIGTALRDSGCKSLGTVTGPYGGLGIRVLSPGGVIFEVTITAVGMGKETDRD